MYIFVINIQIKIHLMLHLIMNFILINLISFIVCLEQRSAF